MDLQAITKYINLTDLIILILLGFFFLRGFTKGLFKTIIGPISFIIASVICYYYYKATHNLINTLIISVVGPFIIHFILWFWTKTFNKVVSEKKEISPISRILGGIFCLLWSGSMFLLCVILVLVIPIKFKKLNDIQNNIKLSRTYSFIGPYVEKFIPTESLDTVKVTNLFNDPQKLKKLESNKDYKKIMANPKIQNLFNNEETLEMIKNKDIKGLLTNPRMKEIFQDEELIKNLLELNKLVIKETSTTSDDKTKKNNMSN